MVLTFLFPCPIDVCVTTPSRKTDVYAEELGAPEAEGEDGSATIGRVPQSSPRGGKGEPRYPLPINRVSESGEADETLSCSHLRMIGRGLVFDPKLHIGTQLVGLLWTTGFALL